ncbi:endoplasmic reticulum resident protein 27 [Aplochiton taeniatus]
MAIAKEKADSALLSLTDSAAVEAFVESADVVIIGFFEGEDSHGYKEFVAAVKQVETIPAAVCKEKEIWADISIASDTIALFRKADNHQENLLLSQVKKLDTDGLVRFFTINELRYITEYNQVTAVGLFNSEVAVHLLLFANRGTKEYSALKDKLAALAPEFTGKFLFVLVNGAVKANARSLDYFGLKSRDLPRVGIYDGGSDMQWVMPEGEISAERVREFCESFLRGDLKEEKQSGEATKTEL